MQWSVCTVISVCIGKHLQCSRAVNGNCGQWFECAVVSVFSGKCVQWLVCAMISVCSGKCVQLYMCGVGILCS